MKLFAKIMLLGALMAAPVMSVADDNHKTDEQLSTEYKYKIKQLKAEIKANKAARKINPTDADLVIQGNAKKAELEEVERKKDTVDEAIKTLKKSQKAAKKAEKAKAKAESAAQAAAALKKK